jgi:hypothetical protein
VKPPGRDSGGDWQWWTTAAFVLVSVLFVIVGLTLLLV